METVLILEMEDFSTNIANSSIQEKNKSLFKFLYERVTGNRNNRILSNFIYNCINGLENEINIDEILKKEDNSISFSSKTLYKNVKKILKNMICRQEIPVIYESVYEATIVDFSKIFTSVLIQEHNYLVYYASGFSKLNITKKDSEDKKNILHNYMIEHEKLQLLEKCAFTVLEILKSQKFEFSMLPLLRKEIIKLQDVDDIDNSELENMLTYLQQVSTIEEEQPDHPSEIKVYYKGLLSNS